MHWMANNLGNAARLQSAQPKCLAEVEERRFGIAQVLVQRATAGEHKAAESHVGGSSELSKQPTSAVAARVECEQLVHFIEEQHQRSGGRKGTEQAYRSLKRERLVVIRHIQMRSQRGDEILLGEARFAVDVDRLEPRAAVEQPLQAEQNRALANAAPAHDRIVTARDALRDGLD